MPRSAASPTSPPACAARPKPNQIVVSRRVYGIVEPYVEGRAIDDLVVKGFNHPILAAEILRWKGEPSAEAAAE